MKKKNLFIQHIYKVHFRRMCWHYRCIKDILTRQGWLMCWHYRCIKDILTRQGWLMSCWFEGCAGIIDVSKTFWLSRDGWCAGIIDVSKTFWLDRDGWCHVGFCLFCIFRRVRGSIIRLFTGYEEISSLCSPCQNICVYPEGEAEGKGGIEDDNKLIIVRISRIH